jgi:hypothetical protein
MTYDPYLLWLYRANAFENVSQWKLKWKDKAESLYGQLLESWCS